MASFTGVGDNVELSVPARGETIDVDISGTYDMTIVFQKEQGSPGSGAWATIDTFTTANATVAITYVTKSDNEVLRLIVTVDTSGTAVATITDNDDRDVRVWKNRAGTEIMTLKQSGLTVAGDAISDNLQLTGAADTIAASTTLTAAANANRAVFTSIATTITVTLPAATGTGNVYTLVTGTTATGDHVYQVANSTDTLVGSANMNVTTTDHEVFQALATSDTVTLNGTTTGGLFGSMVKFTDVASGKFLVEAQLNCSGAQITPFSAAV